MSHIHVSLSPLRLLSISISIGSAVFVQLTRVPNTIGSTASTQPGSSFVFTRWRPCPSHLTDRSGCVEATTNPPKRHSWLRKHVIWCIASTSVQSLRRYRNFFSIFSRWRLSAILDLWGEGVLNCTNHEVYLVVYNILQNLVGIDAVGLILSKFNYSARLASKRLFRPLKFTLLGLFTP